MAEKQMIYNPHLEGDPFYWEGSPSGILLIHGLTATTAEVRPLGHYLHNLGYTVCGPLLPGHYTSPEDLNRVHWRDWVSEVESAFQRLSQNCEQVVLGGESTGALLALYLAAQHPKSQALLLYAPALRLNTRPIDRLRLRLMAPFVSYIPKPNMDGNPLWQGYPVNPLKGVSQLLALQDQVRPLLSRIHQPALIVQGRLDRTVHPGVPDELDHDLGSTVKEIHWMEHSAHCVILDNERAATFDMTRAFIEKTLSQQETT
jgi:carboxylesterase